MKKIHLILVFFLSPFLLFGLEEFHNYPDISIDIDENEIYIWRILENNDVEETRESYTIKEYNDFKLLETSSSVYIYLNSENGLFLLSINGTFMFASRIPPEGLKGAMFEPRLVPFKSARALTSLTETLGGQTVTYGPERLLNWNISSGWVDGAPGDGSGEQLFLSMSQDNKTRGIVIFNGFIDPINLDLYYMNGRAKEITIELDSGKIYDFTLEDLPNGQYISFDEYSESFLITINSIYPGTKYQDLSISGVFANGHPEFYDPSWR